MKAIFKNALGIACASAALSSNVQANEAVTMDPSLTVTYKNYYWKEERRDGNISKINEWTHGLVADFDSGYVNDLVGAVVTAGYAGPLKVKEGDDYSATNVEGLYGTNDELLDTDPIFGFQQAYLKARHMFSGVEFSGSVGVKQRSTETYRDSTSRLLSASSFGYDLAASVDGSNLYFTEITGYSERDAASFNNDLTADDGSVSIDNLRLFGGNYNYEGLTLTGEYGEAKNAKKQTFLKAAYWLELDDESSVDLDIRFGKQKEGEVKASYYNINTTYNFANAYFSFGYNETEDGDYDANYLDGNHDNFNSSLSLFEDFAEKGEKAFVISGGYNFADFGLDGLTWDLWYAKGDDADDFTGFKRREYGSYFSYALDDYIEGLTLAYLYVNYRADGTATDGFDLDTLYDRDVHRLYLTYTVAAF